MLKFPSLFPCSLQTLDYFLKGCCIISWTAAYCPGNSAVFHFADKMRQQLTSSCKYCWPGLNHLLKIHFQKWDYCPWDKLRFPLFHTYCPSLTVSLAPPYDTRPAGWTGWHRVQCWVRLDLQHHLFIWLQRTWPISPTKFLPSKVFLGGSLLLKYKHIEGCSFVKEREEPNEKTMFLGLTVPHICSEVRFHGNNPARTVWALPQRKIVMLFAHDHKFYQCRARTETCLFKLLDLANIYASSTLQAELKKDSAPQKATHGVIIWPSNSTARNTRQRNGSISPHKALLPHQHGSISHTKPCSHTNSRCSSIHRSRRRETTKHLGANERTHKVLYLEWNRGLKKGLFSLKK